jgi:dodecin
MSVGKVTHITAESDTSFEAAIREGIQRASDTVRNMKSAWVKEQEVRIEGGEVTGWRVHLEITFLLDD